MTKYKVRYQIVGGSQGSMTLQAESASEARKNATAKLEKANPAKKIKILEVVKN